jgi:hypothetical protein
MRMRGFRALVVVTVTAALGASSWLAGATASGQPYRSFGVTVKPSSPAPGGPATVTASGYRPGSRVTVSISAFSCTRTCRGNHNSYIELGDARANANGVATDHVTIPRYFAEGSTHVVEANGVTNKGRELTESTTVTLSRARHPSVVRPGTHKS